MSTPKSTETLGHIRAVFDQFAVYYDEVYLRGLDARVFGHVTWTHLLPVLPEDKEALILDAGGGTGRWTLVLAKLGYRIALCDISPGMLRRAEEKLGAAGLRDRVEIKTADIAALPFPDEHFDFVMCEDGPLSISPHTEKTASELVRVLRPGGRLWTGGVGRYSAVLREAGSNPTLALQLAREERHFVQYKGTDTRVFAVHELVELFEQNQVVIEKKYGYRLVTQGYPRVDAVQEGRMSRCRSHFDDSFVAQLAELELTLSEKPALLEMAEYIQILGRKQGAEDP